MLKLMAPTSGFSASLLTRHARLFIAIKFKCNLDLAGFIFTGSHSEAQQAAFE